jgi:hypothetical protein
MVYFQTQIPIWVNFLKVLAMEDAVIFYGHLVKFPATWYILRHFGICCGHCAYFPRFGILYREKSGNHAVRFAGMALLTP